MVVENQLLQVITRLFDNFLIIANPTRFDAEQCYHKILFEFQKYYIINVYDDHTTNFMSYCAEFETNVMNEEGLITEKASYIWMLLQYELNDCHYINIDECSNVQLARINKVLTYLTYTNTKLEEMYVEYDVVMSMLREESFMKHFAKLNPDVMKKIESLNAEGKKTELNELDNSTSSDDDICNDVENVKPMKNIDVCNHNDDLVRTLQEHVSKNRFQFLQDIFELIKVYNSIGVNLKATEYAIEDYVNELFRIKAISSDYRTIDVIFELEKIYKEFIR